MKHYPDVSYIVMRGLTLYYSHIADNLSAELQDSCPDDEFVRIWRSEQRAIKRLLRIYNKL